MGRKMGYRLILLLVVASFAALPVRADELSQKVVHEDVDLGAPVTVDALGEEHAGSGIQDPFSGNSSSMAVILWDEVRPPKPKQRGPEEPKTSLTNLRIIVSH